MYSLNNSINVFKTTLRMEMPTNVHTWKWHIIRKRAYKVRYVHSQYMYYLNTQWLQEKIWFLSGIKLSPDKNGFSSYLFKIMFKLLMTRLFQYTLSQDLQIMSDSYDSTHWSQLRHNVYNIKLYYVVRDILSTTISLVITWVI